MNASPSRPNAGHLFTPAQATFIRGPVSILAASHDANLTPNLTRAVGCALDTRTDVLTLFLSATRSVDVLADLRANRRIAVVFSRPSTDESIQIKADDAEIVTLPADAVAMVEDYHARMIAETGALGFPAPIMQMLFSIEPDDLVAVRCTPHAVFEQTPGPNAGNLLQVTA